MAHEPQTHPGPAPDDFQRAYRSKTKEGRKLRRLRKPPLLRGRLARSRGKRMVKQLGRAARG